MTLQNKLLVAPILMLLLVSSVLAQRESGKQPVPPQSSQENLFKLGVALLQYSDDFEGKLPPMQNQKVAKEALQHFIDDANLIQPGTKHAYVTNPVLSGRKHADFNTKKVVAFYEAEPSPDGARWVLFLPPFDPKVIHFENNSGFVKNYIKRLNKIEWLKFKPVGARD